MTDQEAFDAVVIHARKKEKCLDEDVGQCRFRHGERRCFIGALIPDDLYTYEMDGYGDHDGPYSITEVQEAVPALRGVSHELLLQLQNIHDGKTPDRWHTWLWDVAKRFNLDVTVLGEVF